VPLLGRPDLTQPAVQELLASTDPDVVVSWFWTRRIPVEVLRLAPQGGINVHPSLLPRHRGADPYFWTLALEDGTTGVTVHQVTAHYDEGPVLLQREVLVPPEVNAWGLARALDRPSLELLREGLLGMERGTLGPPEPQDPSLATMAPEPQDDDCELLWDWPASRVVARVRAASPEPGAFTGFGDDTLVVLRAREASAPPQGLDPGDVVLTREGVTVQCGHGTAVVLLAVRREDGDEVLRGERIRGLFPTLGVLP
jgi:methionyl-tRNA formyltransferase